MMAGGLGGYVGTWTVMMAAMMLPSTAPLVRLYRRASEALLLAAGYLGVWALVGLAAYATDMYADVGAAVVLLAAAAYELTPLKSACLRRCRTPVDFLFTQWRRGAAGMLRLGVRHGIDCVGCCWALMAVFVLVAAMSVAWAAVFASVVFIQKVLPLPRWSSAATAVALAAAAVIVQVA